MLTELAPAVLSFPQIDPVLVEIGPIVIRWYALAYIGGLLLGWRWMLVVNRRWAPRGIGAQDIDDLLFWATLGVILGGRLGYVLFYNLEYFLAEPLKILQVWQGGMSFHGGFAGVCLAVFLFARARGLPLLQLADLMAVVTPIGLFFGRLANFINAELYGRVSDVPWAMVFPGGGPAPRHPSQLYEAALEGLVLFLLLHLMLTRGAARRPGLLTGAFILGYGLARAFVELFREPDAHIQYLTAGSTMGQQLSAPMVIAGAALIWLALRRRPLDDDAAA